MVQDIYTTERKYKIIYADPPWQFRTYSVKGQGRSAERHYPTMPKTEIQALPVSRICEKDCVLFLWVTAPCLIEGIELIKAWGFTYKTIAFTWIKKCKRADKIFTGMGYYTRSNAEYCLIATKGKGLKRKSRSVSSVIMTPIEEHSMQQLSDDGIMSMTSENDLDVVNMDESPNAVFIIVPDERFTRHRFVTLFITQMYKELVEKANLNLRRNQTETAILKRNTYFVLDEFANLPKFENIEGMVTVARSRGIRFLFVLQSYSQLTAKYGRDVGDIIKTNCNVKIFIGSDDSETRKEFSELCGQKKIKQFSVNTNADNPASSNTGATLQPLISVGMLERLNGDEKGDAIVSVRGYEPIWTVFTPSYELKKVYFPEGKAAIGKREAVLFEKENYVFDITGDVGQKIEDKISELIEEQEAEEARADENDKANRVAKLTKQWDDVEAELQRVVDNICVYLDGKDEKAVRQAAYEHKVRLLLAITEHYNRSIANEIRVAADKIQLELLPRMKEYQEQATK